jgi:hypothetical protein
VAVVYVVGLAVLALVEVLGVFGGFIGANRGVLTATWFLLGPVVVLARQGFDPAAFGIHGFGISRALLATLIAAAIVFPPYAVGYSAWSRIAHDSPLRIPAHPLSDFPEAWQGRPEIGSSDRGIHAWFRAERFWLLGTEESAVPVMVEGCGCPFEAVGTRNGVLVRDGLSRECEEGGPLRLLLSRGRGASCPVEGSTEIVIRVEAQDVSILAGAAAEPSGSQASPARSFLWIPWLLLVQFLVVALPEEVFFRGYVQGRLAPLFRRRIRVLGVDLGMHVVVASALFAIAHLVAIPAPFRLAVFFPGLLFGWLRERTGGVLAPTLMHAASNVLLEVLVRYHGG